MIDTREFHFRARIDPQRLEAWIEAGWLLPQHGAASRLSEADIARAEFIRDLRDDLGVNTDGIDVILSLIDQLHGVRHALREVLLSIHAQPETMKRRDLRDIPDASARKTNMKHRQSPRAPGKVQQER
jgi:chaperone modulatory protein CbpM